MRDGSVIRFRNFSQNDFEFRTFGLRLLFDRGWAAWWRGCGVLYFYHSHRQSTSPSETDEAFMRILKGRWPHVDHLIFTPDRQYDIWRMA